MEYFNNRLTAVRILIFVTVYHDACIENLLLRLILFTFRIKLKAPPSAIQYRHLIVTDSLLYPWGKKAFTFSLYLSQPA